MPAFQFDDDPVIVAHVELFSVILVANTAGTAPSAESAMNPRINRLAIAIASIFLFNKSSLFLACTAGHYAY